jgi:hypothetical protein
MEHWFYYQFISVARGIALFASPSLKALPRAAAVLALYASIGSCSSRAFPIAASEFLQCASGKHL